MRAAEFREKRLLDSATDGSEVLSLIGLQRALQARVDLEHYQERLDLLVRRGLGLLAKQRTAESDPLTDAILLLSPASASSETVSSKTGASTPGRAGSRNRSPQMFAATRLDAYDPTLLIDAICALIAPDANALIAPDTKPTVH